MSKKQPVCLSGVFRAEMTADESNAWCIYVMGLAEWKAYSLARAGWNNYNHGGERHAASELFDRLTQAETVMFGIAERWCAENVKTQRDWGGMAKELRHASALPDEHPED